MRRQPQRVHLGEAGVKQRAQLAVAATGRFRHPLRQRLRITRVGAQRGEDDGLEQRAIARIAERGQAHGEFRLQRTTVVQDRIQRARGGGADAGTGGGAHAPGGSGRELR